MTEEGNPAPLMQQKKSGAPIGLIAITIIMAAALVFLVVMYFDQKNKMTAMETELTHEKDSLANELRKMILNFDALKTDNDSLNARMEREKQRIIKLLEVNASNIQLIRKYRNEISTMRDIMKSYIVQIDSLNTRNKILIAENVEIRQQYKRVQNTNVELEKAKEELTSKVTIASVIQAKDIVAAALNKKRKETTKINLLDKLRICFTLRENPIAEAGQKEVFMRVIRPDSLVITSSSENVFDFTGKKLIYSASRVADYMNQDIEMCIYLDNTGDFIPGNYNVELYLEENMIGQTNFMLTKR
jgi:FlaG/FlaF family flagellin (archaellin)